MARCLAALAALDHNHNHGNDNADQQQPLYPRHALGINVEDGGWKWRGIDGFGFVVDFRVIVGIILKQQERISTLAPPDMIPPDEADPNGRRAKGDK